MKPMHKGFKPVCAAKILQTILRSDNVPYTIIPVQGIPELQKAFQEHHENLNSATAVVLINCGATVDLIELLEPKEDVIIWVADSHRPIDVCNIYNDGQIRLLMAPKPADHIPEFSEIFDQESDAEAEQNESDEDLFEDSEEASNRRQKRQKFDEDLILKRREKRLWEEKRLKILFEYTQFSYYGESTAMLMFEMAWRLSRETNELLWWAIVGLTEQQVLGKIESDDFLLTCGKLQSHVVRLAVPGDDDERKI
nr:EOG090X08GG [Triops cancriformis]